MTPEVLNGIFAISGAVIGAIIAGLFAWLIQAKYRSKKILKVLISKPKALIDIHDSLQGLISINISGEPVNTVSSVDYYILNSGNEVLRDIDLQFAFSDNVRILGGNCPKLNFSTNSVEDFALHLDERSSCEIKAGFLNPGEEARGHLLLNAIPSETSVNFRQAGVVLEVQKNYDPARSSAISEILYEAAKSNFFLDTYLKLALPAYKKQRDKNGI